MLLHDSNKVAVSASKIVKKNDKVVLKRLQEQMSKMMNTKIFLLHLHRSLCRVVKINSCHQECTTSETTHKKSIRQAMSARTQIHPLVKFQLTQLSDSKLLRNRPNLASLHKIRPQPLCCERRNFPYSMRMFTLIRSAKQAQ